MSGLAHPSERAGPPPPLPLTSRALAALHELARERPLPLRVRGACMAPRLADGARVEIAPASFYWPGDVVALAGGDGRLLLHRLLGYRWHAGRIACVTRGDGCARHDGPVEPGRLLGRALGPAPSARERLLAIGAFLRLACRRRG